MSRPGPATRRRRAACGCRPAAAAAPGPAHDRHEVRVAAPARHHVLVQVCGDAGAADVAEVHAHVEPLGPAGPAQDAKRCGAGSARDLGRLGGVEIGVVGDVPVRDHEHVTRVVRGQVEHHVRRRPLGRQSARPRRTVKGLPGRTDSPRPSPRLALSLDVGHPVRGPQPVEPVRHPGPGLGLDDDRVIAAGLSHRPAAAPRGRRDDPGTTRRDLGDRVADRHPAPLVAGPVPETTPHPRRCPDHRR